MLRSTLDIKKHIINDNIHILVTIIRVFMVISREKLSALIEGPNADIERLTTLSSDGKNLLTRMPREVVSFLKLQRGDKLRWLVNAGTKEVRLEIEHSEPNNS